MTGDGREKGEKESMQGWMEGCRQDLYSSGVRPAEHAGFSSIRREAGSRRWHRRGAHSHNPGLAGGTAAA